MIQIVNNDALTLLRSLPDESVDAVITDPPFGIGFTYNARSGSACFDDTPEYYAALQRKYPRWCVDVLSADF